MQLKARDRRGIRIGVASMALSAAVLTWTSGTSEAHTPAVNATCYELKIVLTDYEGPASNNVVTVTIDGTPTIIQFGSGLSRTFSWDSLQNHTWSVVLDANLNTGDATYFDATFGPRTQQACPAATTTTTAPAVTTTTPVATTTTVPATTTTTVAETTTTAPAGENATTTTTTTTVAETTTTALASGGPVPPGDDTTTTAAVASGGPVPPAAPAVGAEAPLAPTGPTALPRTGNGTDTTRSIGLAVAALLAGAALITVSRRETAPDPID